MEDDQVEEAVATLSVQPRCKRLPKKQAEAKKSGKAGRVVAWRCADPVAERGQEASRPEAFFRLKETKHFSLDTLIEE